MDAGSPSAVAPQRTFVDDIIHSILTPGVTPGLVAAINSSLLLLLLTLLAMVVKGAADVHTGVMAFLALGLLGSVNFFVSHLRAAEAEAAEKEGGAVPAGPAEDSAAPASPVDAAGSAEASEADSGAPVSSGSRASGARRRRQA